MPGGRCRPLPARRHRQGRGGLVDGAAALALASAVLQLARLQRLPVDPARCWGLSAAGHALRHTLGGFIRVKRVEGGTGGMPAHAWPFVAVAASCTRVPQLRGQGQRLRDGQIRSDGDGAALGMCGCGWLIVLLLGSVQPCPRCVRTATGRRRRVHAPTSIAPWSFPQAGRQRFVTISPAAAAASARCAACSVCTAHVLQHHVYVRHAPQQAPNHHGASRRTKESRGITRRA